MRLHPTWPQRLLPVITVIALVLAPALSLVIVPRGVDAEADDPIAAIAPADTWLYVSATTDRFSDQAVLADDLMDRAGLGATIDMTIAQDPGWDQWNTMLALLDPYIGGRVGIFADESALATAVETRVNAGTTPRNIEGVAFALETPSPGAVADQFAAVIADESTTITQTNLAGIPAYAFSETKPDGNDGFFFPLEDVVVVTFSEATSLRVIAAFYGDEASLADTDAYRGFADQQTGDPIATLFLNLAPAYRAIREDAASQPDVSPSDLAVIDQLLAIESAGPMLAMLWADPDGFRLRTVSRGTDGDQPATIGASMVPVDTALYLAGSTGTNALNLSSIFSSLDATAQQMSGGKQTLQDALGFDIRGGLLDHLSGQWAMGAKLQVFATPPLTMTLIAETDDPTVVAATIDQMSELVVADSGPSTRFSTRAVNGGTVYAAVSGSDPTATEWGVVDGRAFVTYGVPAETALQPPVSSLADAPRYRDAMSHFPENRTFEFYFDIQPLMTLLNMALASPSSSGGIPAPTLALDWLASANWQEGDLAINEVMIGIP